MKFKKFADYLKRLEKISGRLLMTDILVKLLSDLKKNEIREGIYLMMGGLAPKFRSVEFYMAEKMVIRSLVKSSGEEIEDVVSRFKKVGDLGEVIEEIGGDKKSEELEILEVFKKLKKIAEEEGNGSQERKISGLADLLAKLSGREARFVVRMVLGKLRLGFSSKTILDALSVMKKGDKTLRKRLDKLEQVHPDVGLLVKEVKEKGIKKAEKEITVEVGVPVMMALCQRLNTSEEIIAKMGEVAVERKFDGTRVEIHFDRKKREDQGRVRTFTRNLDETSHMFPELRNLAKWVKGRNMILDTEAVGINPKTGKILSFQETITRKRKHGIEEAASKIPLRFYLFDILYLNGRNLLTKTYEKRRMILEKVIKKNKTVVVDEMIKTSNASEVHRLHEQFLKDGYEGAVIKRMDGEYLPGRQGWNWVKIKESEGKTGKLSDTLDVVVMGFYRGKGKRAQFGLGAFLAGIRKGEEILTIAKVGTGLTDKQFREIKKRLDKLVTVKRPKEYRVEKNLIPDVWVEPELVVEVAADEITRSPAHTAEVALRFPRLIGFRDDKGVREITTIKEVRVIKGK